MSLFNIIKVKSWPLSGNSQNRVFRPFLKTSLLYSFVTCGELHKFHVILQIVLSKLRQSTTNAYVLLYSQKIGKQEFLIHHPLLTLIHTSVFRFFTYIVFLFTTKKPCISIPVRFNNFIGRHKYIVYKLLNQQILTESMKLH